MNKDKDSNNQQQNDEIEVDNDSTRDATSPSLLAKGTASSLISHEVFSPSSDEEWTIVMDTETGTKYNMQIDFHTRGYYIN
jgi:hypothetical protein